MSAVLSTSALVVGYGRQGILPPVELAIRSGELWVLAGRNGAGKTTLLRTLLGLLNPVSGLVRRRPGASLAYLPQRQALDPIIPMRARDLVAEGVETGWSFLRPWLMRSAAARIREAMAATATADLALRSFAELSEGQKQRVLLARAFAAAPDLMVLDEPTSAMDLKAEQEAIDLIGRRRSEQGTAVIVVAHHLPAALAAADRMLFVDAEHGLALAAPVPEVLQHPVFRAQFAGSLGEADRG